MNKIAEKIKSDKKLFVIVAVCLIGILLLFVSEIIPENKDDKKEAAEKVEEINFDSYEKSLENRLKTLIENIDGAGRVQVMITVESGDEKVYATEINKSDKEEEKKYVLIDTDGTDSGLLLKIAQPEIRGVAVVCQGADSPKVRQEITGAVTSVLGVSTNRVNISKMK